MFSLPMLERFDPARTIVANYGDRVAPKGLRELTVLRGATLHRAVPITVEPLVLGRDPCRPFHPSPTCPARTASSVSPTTAFAPAISRPPTGRSSRVLSCPLSALSA